jgi:hypothetical protein
METVVVLGYEHLGQCLVARYRRVLDETGGRGDPDGFPWCTCSRLDSVDPFPRKAARTPK